MILDLPEVFRQAEVGCSEGYYSSPFHLLSICRSATMSSSSVSEPKASVKLKRFCVTALQDNLHAVGTSA